MGENLYRLVKIAVWLFIIFAKINEIIMTACNVSLPTLQVVSKCPTTEEELLATKERKDCQSLAEFQKCVRPQNFTYHCVINFWRNETYEVCAPAIFSQGRCLEFNIYGRVIQELKEVSCVREGCLTRFSSADTLQYAVCSKFVKKEKSNPKSCLNSNWNETSTLFAVISGVLFLLLVFVFVWVCRRKMMRKNWRGIQQKTEEFGLSSHERAEVKNLNGEEIDNAVQNITDEFESRKRRKRKFRNPENTSRLENPTEASYAKTEREPLAEKARRLTTTSTKSCDSTVSVKRGYDTDTLVYFLKRHNLQDCAENLRKSKIDCLQTFLELNEEKLKEIGLEYGQVRKCLHAVEEAKKKPKKDSLTA